MKDALRNISNFYERHPIIFTTALALTVYGIITFVDQFVPLKLVGDQQLAEKGVFAIKNVLIPGLASTFSAILAIQGPASRNL